MSTFVNNGTLNTKGITLEGNYSLDNHGIWNLIDPYDGYNGSHQINGDFVNNGVMNLTPLNSMANGGTWLIQYGGAFVNAGEINCS